MTCAADDIRLSVAKLIFDAVGSPYEVFVAGQRLDLLDLDGDAKYHTPDSLFG